MPEWFRALSYVTYLFFSTLILLEIAVRIWGYSERHITDPIYDPFPASGEVSYVHKPGLRHVRGRGMAIFDTDRYGLRTTSPDRTLEKKRPNELRIAIFGDSLSFGEGVVETRNVFSEKLGELLRSREKTFDVTILNFGVSGYSVRNMVANLAERALSLEPDICLLAVISGDFDLDARSAKADGKGYIYNPGRLVEGVASLRRFSFLKNIRLVYLFRDLLEKYRKASPTHFELDQEGVPDSYRHVTRFRDFARSHYCESAVVILTPTPWLLPRLAADGIRALDLSSVRRTLLPEESSASRFDWHPSAKLHQRFAEGIAHFVQQDLLPPLKKNSSDPILKGT